jgi:hypothetical protein
VTGTSTSSGQHVVLSPEDITMIRQALAACSRLLTRAQHDAGDRCPDGLLYDINLAIDYLDFAPAARSRR